MKKNILFSTTRQWNPGDEFIFFGIRNLLNELGLEFNTIIYNRHPSINPVPVFRRHRWSRLEEYPKLDNSFFLDVPNAVDYVIFAGTPEWWGDVRVDPLLKYIMKNKLRCSFIGVGVDQKRSLSNLLINVLENNTDLIIARDETCYDMIRKYKNARLEVCPALFASKEQRQRVELKKMGIVLQTPKTPKQAIPSESYKKCIKEYNMLEKYYNVTYIANYIDDYLLARELGKNVFYSSYSEDYLNAMDIFDFVVSTRIHGCGLASSLGIPNALIPHDGRYSAAIKFKTHILEDDQSVIEYIRNLNFISKSNEIIENKLTQKTIFKEIISKNMIKDF
jgi:hypothetical protein